MIGPRERPLESFPAAHSLGCLSVRVRNDSTSIQHGMAALDWAGRTRRVGHSVQAAANIPSSGPVATVPLACPEVSRPLGLQGAQQGTPVDLTGDPHIVPPGRASRLPGVRRRGWSRPARCQDLAGSACRIRPVKTPSRSVPGRGSFRLQGACACEHRGRAALPSDGVLHVPL